MRAWSIVRFPRLSVIPSSPAVVRIRAVFFFVFAGFSLYSREAGSKSGNVSSLIFSVAPRGDDTSASAKSIPKPSTPVCVIFSFCNLSNLEKGIKKYHWKWDNGLIIPNFGCVYSRDKNLGKDLLNIAKKYKLKEKKSETKVKLTE